MKRLNPHKCPLCGKLINEHTKEEHYKCINMLYKVAKRGGALDVMKKRLANLPESDAKDLFVEIGKKY